MSEQSAGYRKTEIKERKVEMFRTNLGAQIYQIPIQAFPMLAGYAYIILVDDLRILLDTGSGYGRSHQDLMDGIAFVEDQLGYDLLPGSLTHILITHGHIDHFGGLANLVSLTDALVGVHELDRRNISNYEERLAVISHRLGNYFIEAGLSEERQRALLNLYQVNKLLFHSCRVDFTFEAHGMQVGPLHFFHVPGHCSGHVAIRLHNVCFTGDHVLSKTSPHMAPETLTSHTGLSHYLESLTRLEEWVHPGVDLFLPGHEDVILDLPKRIKEIKTHHMERLGKTLDLVKNPVTISEVADGLFGQPNGYDALLAIEEAGAHLEYLYQRGYIGISNSAELEGVFRPIPLRYVRL